MAHLADATRVVRDRTIRVHRHRHADRREHADRRDRDTVEAGRLHRDVHRAADEQDGNDRGFHADRETGDDVRRRAGLGRLGDAAHRASGRVVLGHETDRDAGDSARDDREERSERGEDPTGLAVYHVERHRLGQEVRKDEEQTGGNERHGAERVRRVALGERAHHEDADERRDEAGGDEGDGEEHRPEAGLIRNELRGCGERDAGDHGTHIRLEDVGAKASDVTHVVADVVGDRGGVARVVLGDAGLDLADQVGADVGGLGIDAAAHTGEERDRAGAHREAGDDLTELGEAGVAEQELPLPDEDRSDAEEAEGRHGESHHRAAGEGDTERGGLPAGARGFGRAHVGLGGRGHAGPARRDGAESADHVRDAGAGADGEAEQHGDDEEEGQKDRVLALEEGHGAELDLLGEVLHRLRARGLADDPTVGQEAGQKPDDPDREGIRRQILDHVDVE